MSDNPENLEPGDQDKPEGERASSPGPDQVWPSGEEAGEPAPGSDAGAPADDDLGWAEEVEKIDRALEEIRQENDTGEALKAPLEAAGDTEGPDRLVSGRVETPPGSEPAHAAAVSYEVRKKSESELGQLWGNVFFSVEHPAPRMVVVTGARRGDGATQIATSLALVGAEAHEELRIALVDFNLRDPGVAGALSVANEPGVTDVLNGRASLDSAMQELALRNGNKLYVLPLGASPEHPLGLLKSRQVQALIAQLREQYDHTILDVTTVNVHPDPQVLGSLADGALLVVRAGETPRETVAEAKKRLDLAGVRCLGLVLNQRSEPIPDFFYRNI